MMDANVIVFILTILHGIVAAVLPNGISRPSCYAVIDRGLFAYDCSNNNWEEVPQHLKTRVQMLNLHYNRISDLYEKSFASYSYLKYLYLSSNFIQSIQNGTFSHLTSLEAIDLSKNHMKTIPLGLFQLPSLRDLYYEKNNLLNLEADLQNLEQPIAAPLQTISIAECKLSTIPHFGILPDVLLLNISYNAFNEILPEQFSQFCSLTTIAIEESVNMNSCICKTLKFYFNKRSIGVKGHFECVTKNEEFVDCPDASNATVDNSDYDSCMDVVRYRNATKAEIQRSRQIWMWMISGTGALFFILICVFYYLHRRNRKKFMESVNFNKEELEKYN